MCSVFDYICICKNIFVYLFGCTSFQATTYSNVEMFNMLTLNKVFEQKTVDWSQKELLSALDYKNRTTHPLTKPQRGFFSRDQNLCSFWIDISSPLSCREPEGWLSRWVAGCAPAAAREMCRRDLSNTQSITTSQAPESRQREKEKKKKERDIKYYNNRFDSKL